MKNNEINKTSYIIVFAISIITILLVFVGLKIYNEQMQYNNENNFILNNLSEIKKEELDNFLTENNDTLLFIANSNEKNAKVRKELKKIIEKNDYENIIVYLNSNEIDQEYFVNFVNKYGSSNVNTKKIIPDSLLIIKGQKITTIININKSNVSLLNEIIQNKYYGD